MGRPQPKLGSIHCSFTLACWSENAWDTLICVPFLIIHKFKGQIIPLITESTDVKLGDLHS